ncbi:hypothetical protein [Faecalibaculum rodentium]|uniref:hypothetical protein n=1 Tax=Faecalibaculum rodentium TaxID=1702221 RepID=UPI002730BB1C|nr:hypothetical protein [Faecalibaculum rodentium]
MPYYPEPEDPEKGQPYPIDSFWEHLVAEYTGLTMYEVQDLDWIDFLLLRRDAFIQKMSQTDEGQKYLRNAWLFEQTDADREGLRRLRKQLGG